ncbi:MAG: hypothetical protein ACRDPW_10945, partial [Mycobacteriales bacterium]
FDRLEQLCLQAYDQIVGLQLSDLSVDGCLVNQSKTVGTPRFRRRVDQASTSQRGSVSVRARRRLAFAPERAAQRRRRRLELV